MVFTWWELTTSIAAGVFIGKFGMEAINISIGMVLQHRQEKKLKELSQNLPEGMQGFPFSLPLSFDIPYMPQTNTRTVTTSGTPVETSNDARTGQYL